MPLKRHLSDFNMIRHNLSRKHLSVLKKPSVRKFAREIGVDLSTIQGSGPGGRITEDDVKRASRDRLASSPAVPPSSGGSRQAPQARALPDFSQWGPVTREPVSRLRRTAARN